MIKSQLSIVSVQDADYEQITKNIRMREMEKALRESCNHVAQSKINKKHNKNLGKWLWQDFIIFRLGGLL